MGQGVYPAASFEVITPSDTVKLSARTRGIYIGGTGDLELKNLDDETVLVSNIPAGSVLPISTDHILDGNTTATLIVALYDK